MKRLLKEWGFRKWYWYVSRTDKNAEVLFMNFGYFYDGQQLELKAVDEKNRFSVQLYHKLASHIELSGKVICEIGSGRGGGISYIHKAFSPQSSIGLDINHRAVKFCSKHYNQHGLKFIQGNAQSLPFKDEEFDVILNVESSHRYPQFNSFLSEAYRSLKPGGYLLITDFRSDFSLNDMENDIKSSKFDSIHHEIITSNVVNALKSDDSRRRELVQRLVPRVLRKTALNFAGAIGSDTFNRFYSEKYIYFLYVLRKPL